MRENRSRLVEEPSSLLVAVTTRDSPAKPLERLHDGHRWIANSQRVEVGGKA